MEMYIDDMLVKSKEDHLDDFKETFNTLRQYSIKLNSSKCAFGVSSGKFIGFMVSQRGIEANPEKVRAILEMSSPKTIKEVQSLTGRVAAFNRFVSRAMDKCLPFFKTLKRAFCLDGWMRSSIPGTKALLKQPPTPESVQGGRRLVPLLGNIHNYSQRVDLGREQETTSSVLHQLAFQGAEARYPRIEKITFALIMASRKLRPYF